MDEYFYSRLDDLLSAAAKGEIAAGDFLSPAEAFAANEYYKRLGASFVLFGRYEKAERKLIVALPDWADYMTPEECCADFIIPVRITSSGYVKLTHRDYMGALLGLGIDRSKVGDICPDERGAVVFARESIAAFLTSYEMPLTKVGADTVKTGRAEISPDFDGGRKFEKISGVAASERIDSVAAALTSLTREKAKDGIRAGNVQINYSDVFDPDVTVREGDVISVRGVGKFVINRLSDRTKKDRLRVEAEKYV